MDCPAPVVESIPEDLEDLLDRAFRYAFSLARDRADAEDLVQDAVAAMLARGCQWRPAYLFTTVRNRFIDTYRRKQTVRFVSLETEADPSMTSDAAETLLFPDSFEAARMRRALEALRVDEREALLLSILEGYTAQDIAGLTGRPRGTVLSLIFRAKRKVRAALESEPDAFVFELGAA